MIAVHEPPAIVEQAPGNEGPFDEIGPESPEVHPDSAEEPADADPDAPLPGAQASSPHPADLIREERGHLCNFLAALVEFDRLGLWRDLGHPSLLAYLRRELRLSSASAYQRTVAVDLLRRFPELLEPLRDGRLCLGRVVEIARVITPANRGDVLPRFCRA